MKILLVEDNRGDARLFEELVREIPGQPHTVTTVGTLADAEVAVVGHDVVFLDLSLPDAHGLATLTSMLAATRQTPIVVLTGNVDETVAVDAVKSGAQDYVIKAEITPSLIAKTACYAVERKLAEENTRRLAQSDEAARRARFKSTVTAAITASFDLEVTLAEVAKLLVPMLGEVAVIDVVRDGDGGASGPEIVRVAHGAATDALEAQIGAVAYRYVPGPTHPRSPVITAIRERRTILTADLDAIAPDQAYRETALAIGASSMLVTPLVARERVVGAISYVKCNGDQFGDDLRLFAEEVAERIALGIDNARLYAAAQRAIRGRDELLAVVSHDLRNPLNIVTLVLQMVERDPGTLSDAMPRAMRGVERMQRLIEDLLDVARIDAGTLRVDARPLEVASVLDDALEQHRALAADKRITLVREIPHELGDAHADRHRLGQAIANLLGNALKFTPPGGSIRLGAAERGAHVVMWISDTGPGIAPEHVDHIFDRFWQPQQRRDGVGLGLAIVKGIVDAHGGSIEVESPPGAGTTFRIVLPMSPALTTALA